MPYLRLTIEPIPTASRLASLAKLLPRGQWDCLRRGVYRRAGYRCRICGRDSRLCCHEVWQFNEQTGYQWLHGFKALCRDCHAVKHIFFVHEDNRRVQLHEHFRTVNRVSREQAQDYLYSAKYRQERFNHKRWIINYGPFNSQIPCLGSIQQRRTYVRLNRPTYAGYRRTSL